MAKMKQSMMTQYVYNGCASNYSASMDKKRLMVQPSKIQSTKTSILRMRVSLGAYIMAL